jgi:hypothetical protein
MERLKKYVYEDWIRNEQIREKQEKPLKISVKVPLLALIALLFVRLLAYGRCVVRGRRSV